MYRAMTVGMALSAIGGVAETWFRWQSGFA